MGVEILLRKNLSKCLDKLQFKIINELICVRLFK